jgi:hypothetical protein
VDDTLTTNSSLLEGLEAPGGDFQVIVGRVQAADVVQTSRAALGGFDQSRGRIGKGDVRTRDHCSRCVHNDARQFRVSLRECERACHHEKHGHQEEPVSHLSHVTFLFKELVVLVYFFASPSLRMKPSVYEGTIEQSWED